MAERLKELSLRLVANIPTEPTQKINNIQINLTIFNFFMKKGNIFKWFWVFLTIL